MPASEVLVNTPAIKSNISSGNFSQLPSLMQQGRGDGMDGRRSANPVSHCLH
ncbi:MAG: hypothetical protein H0U72_00020 [Nitrosospira sp.]|nr:hypothetical protein [Nitrosospira sp.]